MKRIYDENKTAERADLAASVIMQLEQSLNTEPIEEIDQLEEVLDLFKALFLSITVDSEELDKLFQDNLKEFCSNYEWDDIVLIVGAIDTILD